MKMEPRDSVPRKNELQFAQLLFQSGLGLHVTSKFARPITQISVSVFSLLFGQDLLYQHLRIKINQVLQ